MTLILRFLATVTMFVISWIMFPNNFYFAEGLKTVVIVAIICFAIETIITAITACTVVKMTQLKPFNIHQIYIIGIIVDILSCWIAVIATTNIYPDFSILTIKALIATIIVFTAISLSDLRWIDRYRIYV